MARPSRTPYPSGRWLHALSVLLGQVSRADRISTADTGAPSRRLRQRLSTAQRLLDPLPPALRASDWSEHVLWTALRWGGGGLALALLLQR